MRLVMNVVSNPVDAYERANYIGIRPAAAGYGCTGTSLVRCASEHHMARDVFASVSTPWQAQVVRWVIQVVPRGIQSFPRWHY